MVLLGMTYAGKRITGFNYILEFIPDSNQKNYITIFALLDSSSMLIISSVYEFASRDWYPQQVVGLVLSILGMTYCAIFMSESPKFLWV